MLRPKGRPWFDAETASASFGQGVSVTTLQLAMAMSAVANGGRLLEPVLVKRVTDGRGELVRDSGVHVRHEVVPGGVARTLAEMLTAVTEEGGTAVEASIPGFRVAGKTSTAQKVDPVTGKYSTEKFTAVFSGFVPVERPRIVVSVVLDEPMIGHYGGDLAGPVFPSRRRGQPALPPRRDPVRLVGVGEDRLDPPPGPRRRYVVSHETPAGAGSGGRARPRRPPAPTSSGPAAALAAGPPPAASVRVPHTGGMGAHDAVVAISKAGLTPWSRRVGTRRASDPHPRQRDSQRKRPCARGARACVMMSAVSTGAGTRPLSLGELARELPMATHIEGNPDVRVTGVCHDSRVVGRDDLFVARTGEHFDGARFVADAVARGASAVMAAPGSLDPHAVAVPVLFAPEPAKALAFAASAVYGHPSFTVDVVGVTGTNGKTTTVHLVRAAIDGALGVPSTGVLGTVGHSFRDWRRPAQHTTPEADEVARVPGRHARPGARRTAAMEGLVARPRARPRRRGQVPGRRLHKPHTRPPRLSRVDADRTASRRPGSSPSSGLRPPWSTSTTRSASRWRAV